jgi:hypothetical protein
VLVALPNLERLRTALRIWPSVSYPHTPAGVVDRLGDYAAVSDQALGRSGPLLLAAVVGLGASVLRWRSLEPPARAALGMAGLWGFGLWLALAVGSYAPNRYIVPALPGMAVLAGFGLATLAARLRPDPGWGRVALVAGLGVLVAVPGVGRYLDDAGLAAALGEAPSRLGSPARPGHPPVLSPAPRA